MENQYVINTNNAASASSWDYYIISEEITVFFRQPYMDTYLKSYMDDINARKLNRLNFSCKIYYGRSNSLVFSLNWRVWYSYRSLSPRISLVSVFNPDIMFRINGNQQRFRLVSLHIIPEKKNIYQGKTYINIRKINKQYENVNKLILFHMQLT